MEAKAELGLRRVLSRWERYDLVAIDEVGYVPLAEAGAELLFQVIADCTEKSAVILTTNLPFSEWTQVIPNARLCKALLDRITDRAHIIETGAESYRFRRTLERQNERGRRSWLSAAGREESKEMNACRVARDTWASNAAPTASSSVAGWVEAASVPTVTSRCRYSISLLMNGGEAIQPQLLKTNRK